ncbi:FeoA family protein [uncultured Allobaculum sp.]|uniref:FeoA family protein n=1 Tax=uncultured Allobaculum sp. TaxID=1187017 RepID=UPI0025929850|nr:FeoA family protein [uncultured Allobaculum sp.]
MKTLNSVPADQSVTVEEFHLDSKTALRLQALGMIPGTRITVLQRKGKGTMIIDLRGTCFFNDTATTENIQVSYDQ